MYSYEEKIENNLFPLIRKINNPQILELGVQSGISTKKFLEICNQNTKKPLREGLPLIGSIANHNLPKYLAFAKMQP